MGRAPQVCRMWGHQASSAPQAVQLQAGPPPGNKAKDGGTGIPKGLRKQKELTPGEERLCETFECRAQHSKLDEKGERKPEQDLKRH